MPGRLDFNRNIIHRQNISCAPDLYPVIRTVCPLGMEKRKASPRAIPYGTYTVSTPAARSFCSYPCKSREPSTLKEKPLSQTLGSQSRSELEKANGRLRYCYTEI